MGFIKLFSFSISRELELEPEATQSSSSRISVIQLFLRVIYNSPYLCRILKPFLLDLLVNISLDASSMTLFKVLDFESHCQHFFLWLMPPAFALQERPHSSVVLREYSTVEAVATIRTLFLSITFAVIYFKDIYE